MPTIAEIRQKYPQYEGMSDDALADALHSKHYSDMPKEEFRSKIGMGVPASLPDRDKFYSSGIYAGSMNPLGPIARTIDAVSSGAQRAPLFGWDDEAQAALATGGGLLGDYEQSRAGFDARKKQLRDEAPIASGLGELAGGLATGGTLAASGATLAGRNLPVIGRTGAAALEGAGYGGLVGAGEAAPGERGVGAGIGAGLGAAVGGGLSLVGDKLASSAAKKASQAVAPTVDDLASASNALYTQADQAGVVIKPKSADSLLGNMKAAAGRLNTNLRPKTAGMVEEIDSMLGQPMSLQQFDELRQSLGLVMKNADPQDVRTLTLMKNQLDGFADRVGSNDITGNVDGFNMLKSARDLWARKSKTDVIEQMLDFSDVDSAKYSQSGMSNALRLRAQQLYRAIQKGKLKGFSAEETELIRKLAKNEMTPAVVNWLGKFAPRGVVSFGAGVLGGGALGIPGGALLPGMAGYGAAAMADRAAIQGANALRDAAASGATPVLKAISNKSVPFIGGASAQAAR